MISGFYGLARLPSDAFAIPALIIVAICYLIPWFILKRQADKYPRLCENLRDLEDWQSQPALSLKKRQEGNRCATLALILTGTLVVACSERRKLVAAKTRAAPGQSS